MTVVYFQNRFTAALADASSEQNLVDSMLPTMHGRKHGFQVDSFDDPWFSKLSLWQGGGDDEESGGSGSGAGAGAGAAAASAAATATPTIDVAGEGYTQTYVVMKPKHLDQGSTARDVFFRFGNWCYSGAVRFLVVVCCWVLRVCGVEFDILTLCTPPASSDRPWRGGAGAGGCARGAACPPEAAVIAGLYL